MPSRLHLALIVGGLCLSACSRRQTSSPSVADSAAGLSTASPAAALDATVKSASKLSDVFETAKGQLSIMPIQHASIVFVFDKRYIYVDPTSEGNYDGLAKADYVLITHTHPDHFDKKPIDALKQPSTTIVGPPDAIAEVGTGIPLKNGDHKSFGSFDVDAVPAYNLVRGPKPGELFHPKGKWNGYVLTFGDKRIYVSGDTECTPEMKGLKHIDVAFVCMNLPYTMPPSEAAECIRAFNPQVVYPYHYRGSNLSELTASLENERGLDIRLRDWYPKK